MARTASPGGATLLDRDEDRMVARELDLENRYNRGKGDGKGKSKDGKKGKSKDNGRPKGRT